jgi:hypothetical protein
MLPRCLSRFSLSKRETPSPLHGFGWCVPERTGEMVNLLLVGSIRLPESELGWWRCLAQEGERAQREDDKDGAPDRTRTCNLRLRRPSLYPIEPRVRGQTDYTNVARIGVSWRAALPRGHGEPPVARQERRQRNKFRCDPVFCMCDSRGVRDISPRCRGRPRGRGPFLFHPYW